MDIVASILGLGIPTRQARLQSLSHTLAHDRSIPWKGGGGNIAINAPYYYHTIICQSVSNIQIFHCNIFIYIYIYLFIYLYLYLYLYLYNFRAPLLLSRPNPKTYNIYRYMCNAGCLGVPTWWREADLLLRGTFATPGVSMLQLQ